MKLVIFGATGGTGRELLQQALAGGHEVTACVRSPDKLGEVEQAGLRVLRGDVLVPADVENAVAGQDAVFSAIGAGAGRTSLRADGTRNIVEAMEKGGVRRLVCLSSLGVGDSSSNLSAFTKYVVIAVFLRHAFADHERQEAIVRQSALDWIIVRPPHLTNGPRTGTYRHGFRATDTGIEGKVSRADVADFMLRQLTDDTYLRQTPGVSY